MSGEPKTEAPCKPWWADWSLSLLKTIIPVVLIVLGGGYLGFDSLKASVGAGVTADARTEAVAVDKKLGDEMAGQVNAALDEIAEAAEAALTDIADELEALDEVVAELEENGQETAVDLKVLRRQLGIARAKIVKRYASVGDFPPGGPPSDEPETLEECLLLLVEAGEREDDLLLEDDLPPTVGAIEEAEDRAKAVEEGEPVKVMMAAPKAMKPPPKKRRFMKRAKRVKINSDIFDQSAE